MSNTTVPSNRLTYWAIVPAAGIGKRMRADCPKQYLSLAGRPILEHTIDRLAQHALISEIVVALASRDPYWDTINLNSISKPVMTTSGGEERCDSVLNGLKAIESQAKDNDWVLVHDAARPCLRVDDIEQLIVQCKDTDGGLLGITVKDTMKEVDDDAFITQTLNRDHIWHALTPQMFRYRALRDALELGIKSGKRITDEAMAMELAGIRPKLVSAHADNIKITQPEDLALAEFYLQQQLDQQQLDQQQLEQQAHDFGNDLLDGG